MVPFIYLELGLRLFIPRFLKEGWRSNDFCVSLYLPIIFTSVPGHGDESTPLNRTVVSCNCPPRASMSLIAGRSIRHMMNKRLGEKPRRGFWFGQERPLV